jgi:signal transduction histidine kinase/CheY-like chemotaxis protein
MSDEGPTLLELAAEHALAATGASGAVVAFAAVDGPRAKLLVRGAAGSAAALAGAALAEGGTDLAARLGAASMLAVTFAPRVGGIGLVAVTQERADAFGDRERAALEAFAALLAASVAELAETRHLLEMRVRERTADLVTANEALRWEVQERQRAEEALRQSKEAAEAASVAKSHFLANMSHELRTPLNSVIGFGSILLKNKEESFNATELLYLTRIHENGRHLLGLINDILDLSKIEAGRVELSYSMVDLAALLSQTQGQLEGSMLKPEVRFVTELPQRLAPFETDATKLQQVLINLVGNALKFTERGTVTVRVTADPTTGMPLRLDVQDTGIGIPTDRREAIFEPFQQGDNTTERRFGGTGLGLTISRSLLQLLGHRIDVQSVPGEGSTFSVHFRQAGRTRPSGAPARPTIGAGSARVASIQGQTVLVIDDEPDARIVLQQYIEDAGGTPLTAASGAEGIELARARAPDLILLDLQLPDVDGGEVLRRLKADPATCTIPVIVVSIVGRERRSELAGAVDVLDKPVSRKALVEAARRHLRTERLRILAVDDDPDARALLQHALDVPDAELYVGADAWEALRLLKQVSPDLVILDLVMPELSGERLLQMLRNDPRYARLPIAVMTEFELDRADRERLDAETIAVLRKGPDLVGELRRLIQHMRRPAAATT